MTLASGNEWCRANHFNKTHFNIELDLINAKRTCGTQRTTQGVEIIYENKIVWNNREDRVIEDLGVLHIIPCMSFWRHTIALIENVSNTTASVWTIISWVIHDMLSNFSGRSGNTQ